MILATQAYQVFYLEDPKNGTNWKIVQVVQNKHVWDVPEGEDIENEDDPLFRTEVDPIVVKRLDVGHVTDDFIDDDL